MGTYLGVTAVERIGARINGTDKRPPIPLKHRLIAIMSNGLYRIAPDVTEEREYDEFYRSYLQGNWLRMTLYQLSEDDAKKCPDEGRVYGV